MAAAAAVILQEAQKEALKATRKATCWDPLQLMVVDVKGNPGQFSRTVDQLTAASVAPSALVMLNAGEVVKTKEDAHWPNYKLIRKTGGAKKQQDILAQVQFSLQFEEFQGEKVLISYLSFLSSFSTHCEEFSFLIKSSLY